MPLEKSWASTLTMRAISITSSRSPGPTMEATFLPRPPAGKRLLPNQIAAALSGAGIRCISVILGAAASATSLRPTPGASLTQAPTAISNVATLPKFFASLCSGFKLESHQMVHAQLSGFVLAGGKSTRMGQDKAAVNLNGRTLLEHALAALREVCRDVAILGKYELYGTLAPVYEDIFPG